MIVMSQTYEAGTIMDEIHKGLCDPHYLSV